MLQAMKEQLVGGFQAIDNYVMMQAAVSAQCYDVNAPLLQIFVDAEISRPTPDTYRGYPGAINNAVRGRITNFYNPDDFALATGTTLGLSTHWEQNQLDYKPDSGLGYFQMQRRDISR